MIARMIMIIATVAKTSQYLVLDSDPCVASTLILMPQASKPVSSLVQLLFDVLQVLRMPVGDLASLSCAGI